MSRNKRCFFLSQFFFFFTFPFFFFRFFDLYFLFIKKFLFFHVKMVDGWEFRWGKLGGIGLECHSLSVYFLEGIDVSQWRNVSNRSSVTYSMEIKLNVITEL